MTNKLYIGYYRVSSAQQGLSGLGLDAQQKSVHDFINGVNGASLLQEFFEVETGKGSNPLERRPQLKAALDVCKRRKAILVLSKLDRLARNVNFVTSLMEAGIDFKIATMPQADKVMIQMYAVMAEWERDQIAARTKAALNAAKARGVQLGRMGPTNLKRNIEERKAKADDFANNLAPVVNGFRAQGLSQVKMVDALNRLNIPAARGGQWSRLQLQRVLARIDGARMNTTTNDAATTGV